MNNYFWLVVLPNLDYFLGTLGILGIVFCIFAVFFYLHMLCEACDEEDEQEALKFAKNTLKVFVMSMFLFFITCFIPTKKDIAQLKVLSVVGELKGVDKIPQKLIDRLNDLLDEEEKKG